MDINALVLKMVQTIVETAVAERGTFFMMLENNKEEQLVTYAECTLEGFVDSDSSDTGMPF